MSDEFSLLDQVHGGMDYAQLQDLFSRLVGRLESAEKTSQLVGEIDQFIQRLVQERERDQRILHVAQADYDSFKEQNQGVFGWLKRHIPFTDTRRQELEHRGDVAQQTAEILADNLVIARAQMVKERLLPPEGRRLGLRADEWSRRWEMDRTNPQAAGQMLQKLNDEIVRSLAFTAELQQDIEAFSQAQFCDAADVQRRDVDLAAARLEFARLQEEIEAEKKIKRSGLKTIAETARNELLISDGQFRRDDQSLECSERLPKALGEAKENLSKVAATAGKVTDAAKKLHALPDQVGQIRQSLMRLDAERTAAEGSVLDRLRIVDERQARVAEAQRSLEQARQTLASLQAAFDAHQAQRAEEKSMPVAVEMEPPAPIVQQRHMALSLVSQAETQHRDVVNSVEVARQDVAKAEQVVKLLKDKITAEQARIRELEKQEPSLRSELHSLADNGQREFAAAANAFAVYLAIERESLELPAYRPDELAAFAFGWLGPRGLERPLAQSLFYPGFDSTRQNQATAAVDRLLQWLAGQSAAIERQRQIISDRRRDALKRHCQQWLGEALAEEACR